MDTLDSDLDKALRILEDGPDDEDRIDDEDRDELELLDDDADAALWVACQLHDAERMRRHCVAMGWDGTNSPPA